MRDLIKKILKEFDSDNVVSFRIIGKADEFLNEQLSQEDKNKLQAIVRKKIKSINPFLVPTLIIELIKILKRNLTLFLKTTTLIGL